MAVESAPTSGTRTRPVAAPQTPAAAAPAADVEAAGTDTAAATVYDGTRPWPHPAPRMSPSSPREAMAAATGVRRGLSASAPRAASPDALRDLRPLVWGAPVPTGPFASYIDGVRARLSAEGLPTAAPGVRVLVADSMEGERTEESLRVEDALDPDPHGAKVTRALVGPVGLARGADVQGWSLARPLLPHPNPDALAVQRDAALSARRIESGSITLHDAVAARSATLVNAVYLAEAHVASAHAHRAAHGTTLVNLSLGASIADQADAIVQLALRAASGTPLRTSLEAQFGARPDFNALRTFVEDGLAQGIERPAFKAARASLTETVRAARTDNVLVFIAASNEGHLTDVPAHSANLMAAPGMITVGATELAFACPPEVLTCAPRGPQVAGFSSDGNDDGIAAPGVSIPVSISKGQPSRADGTSFSTPFAVGTAALMLAANPALSANSIADILRDARVATDIPRTTRDGRGVIDPVAAVRLARAAGR